MAVTLAETFLERLKNGFGRQAIDSCSKWAETYRVMGNPFPGKWNFRHHPWLRDMHDCKSQFAVGQKSSQMGFTEWALNTAFYSIDILMMDVLYVLPSTNPDASNFSAGRFDPALELSPHLANLFTDVKNVGHKRSGTSNLYLRGSKSRAQLKSVPAPRLIFDEVDEMNTENVVLGLERASGQKEEDVFVLMLSTPSIDNFGINRWYNTTSKEHFFFKCPHCSKFIEFVFPDSIVITAEDPLDPRVSESYYICTECKCKLDHYQKIDFLQTGIWVPSVENRDRRGFHVNHMYSSANAGVPKNFASGWLNATRSPADEQEFWNSKMGMTHTVEGSRVTDTDIDQCIGDHMKGNPRPGVITIGIDIGRSIHYEVDFWKFNNGSGVSDINVSSKPIVLDYGKFLDFEQIDELIGRYQPLQCVVDAQPERRKAYELANRFYGIVKICFYSNGIRGKQIHVNEANPEHGISVDRTSWLDLSLGRFKNKTIILPADINLEYRSNIKALVRRYEKDNEGNQFGRYIHSEDTPDHYAHARTYAEIALPIGVSRGSTQNMESV